MEKVHITILCEKVAITTSSKIPYLCQIDEVVASQSNASKVHSFVRGRDYWETKISWTDSFYLFTYVIACLFVYPFSHQNLSLEESWSLLTLFEKSHRGRITNDLDLEHHGKYRFVLALHFLESSIFLQWTSFVLVSSCIVSQRVASAGSHLWPLNVFPFRWCSRWVNF